MLKILALRYSELLLLIAYCSWIVKYIYIYIYYSTSSHFSLLFPLSLLSPDGCGLVMVVCHGLWFDGHGSWGSMVVVLILGHGSWSDGHDAVPRSRCDIPGSWVVVIKCFTTYQTKDPILTNNYPLIQAYNLLRFFRV